MFARATCDPPEVVDFPQQGMGKTLQLAANGSDGRFVRHNHFVCWNTNEPTPAGLVDRRPQSKTEGQPLLALVPPAMPLGIP
jgi:hypothetical protein